MKKIIMIGLLLTFMLIIGCNSWFEVEEKCVDQHGKDNCDYYRCLNEDVNSYEVNNEQIKILVKQCDIEDKIVELNKKLR